MEKDKISIIVVVVLCIGAFFAFKRSPKISLIPKGTASVVVNDVTVIPKTSIPPAVSPQNAAKWEEYNRNTGYWRAASGLKQVEMEETKDGRIVRVKFLPIPVCYAGDLNAIFHDYRQTSSNRIVITIESFVTQKKVALESVSLDELKHGFNKAFTIPHDITGDIMGLFICSDSKHKERCMGKTNIDVNVSLGQTEKSPGTYVDKIYIFDMIVVTGKSVQFVSKFPIDLGSLQGMKSETTLMALGKQKVDGALVEAAKLNQALRSFPPDANKNNLVIKVPYMDKVACVKNR